MSVLEYHVIDVFTDKVFGGNPAGVCLLDAWLEDDILQNIAAENNLSETAFVVKQEDYYNLRWFTPAIEVDLCGHATIASAFVLFESFEKSATEIRFKTTSGIVSVNKEAPNGLEDAKGTLYYLNFPARPVVPCQSYQTFEESLGIKPLETYRAADFLLLVDSEETLLSINPDYSLLKHIAAEIGETSFGTIVTARGDNCDFVSRFFAPHAGINEDPVTGRAHCSLIPFWSERLGKKTMTARQLSRRGGILYCEDHGERVRIGGQATRYLKGSIAI